MHTIFLPNSYATHLAATNEASSSHITTKCVTNSYTSLDDPPPQKMYAVNPFSARAAADQIGRYVRKVTDWRQGVTYSSGAYGTDRPTP